MWGALRGLTYMVRHFHLQLPVTQVRSALPLGGTKRGPTAILAGAIPLPPEALAKLFSFISDASASRVLRAWAFALVFSAVSSLRQTTVQNLVFYGELSVLGKDYRLSQHANSKARNKTPTVSSPRSKISGAAEHGLTMGCSSFGRERTSYGLTLTATLAIAPPHCCRALSLMTRFNGLSNLYCRLLAACLPPSRVATLNTARASCLCLLHRPRACRGKCA